MRCTNTALKPRRKDINATNSNKHENCGRGLALPVESLQTVNFFSFGMFWDLEDKHDVHYRETSWEKPLLNHREVK